MLKGLELLIFQGFTLLFAVSKGRKNVRPSVFPAHVKYQGTSLSIQHVNKKFTAYFLFFFCPYPYTSIAANMNELYFLAVCLDFSPLITCEGSRPYKLSKICR